MKILKIFGLVVGIHVAALILIFANPGCSSSTKPAPSPGDTVAKADPTPPPAAATPAAASPAAAPAPFITAAPRAEPVPAAPILFDPNAAAASGAAPAGAVRFLPTRPNTPVAGALVSEPVKDVVPTTTYIVKSGDSLWTIAKKHKLTVADLTVANGVAANANLQPGQKLLIPAKAGAAAPAAPTAPAAGSAAPAATKAAKAEPAAAPRTGGATTKHLVRTGESLTTIARDYGVRQRDIAVANNITDPAKIRAGHELVIPLPAGKAAPAGAKAPAAATPAVEAPVVPVQNAPGSPRIIRFDEPTVVPAPKP
jgi:LysM repeat protein